MTPLQIQWMWLEHGRTLIGRCLIPFFSLTELTSCTVDYFVVIIPEAWSPPAGWTDTDLPSVYKSFDTDKYVQLENGAKIVAGKVGH